MRVRFALIIAIWVNAGFGAAVLPSGVLANQLCKGSAVDMACFLKARHHSQMLSPTAFSGHIRIFNFDKASERHEYFFKDFYPSAAPRIGATCRRLHRHAGFWTLLAACRWS